MPRVDRQSSLLSVRSRRFLAGGVLVVSMSPAFFAGCSSDAPPADGKAAQNNAAAAQPLAGAPAAAGMPQGMPGMPQGMPGMPQGMPGMPAGAAPGATGATTPMPGGGAAPKPPGAAGQPMPPGGLAGAPGAPGAAGATSPMPGGGAAPKPPGAAGQPMPQGGLAGAPGASGAGNAGTPQNPSSPAGTPEYSAEKVVVQLLAGDISGLEEFISPKCKGPLADVRDGKATDKQKDELKKLFTGLQGAGKPRMESSAKVIPVRNAEGATITFRVKKENDSHKIIEMTVEPSSSKKR